MKKLILSVVALALATSAFAEKKSEMMSWEEATVKANEVLATLSLDEKIEMTHGHNKFFLPGAPAKGLPHVFMVDASAGVRINHTLPDPNEVRHPAKTTQFPATIALASTFNPELAKLYGEAVGYETRMAGAGVLLGPGMNIYRSSQCGRNFEYMGEDPYLAARMVENYVIGMQGTGTMACLKHFVCNNTELYRKLSNSIVDERAIMEIYTPAFKAGIDAGAGSVMTSYNLVNGEWAGQSKYVITDLLRGTLGFKGLVMTDWRSVYDWKKIVLSGQNVEMPGTPNEYYHINQVRDLLKQGELTEKNIDDMIRPMVATLIRFGLYERFRNGQPNEDALEEKFPHHEAVSYQTAAEGSVLLKNDGILPLKEGQSVLLVGRWAKVAPQGGGSSRVKGFNQVTSEQALLSALRSKVKAVEKPNFIQLQQADVVVVATGTYDTEGQERPFQMMEEDEALVRMACAANKKVIVLILSGSGIDMSAWNDKVSAIIYGWYPGQSGMQAIADIMVGKVNPSGKLPATIEKSFKDSPAYGMVPQGLSVTYKSRNTNELWTAPKHYDVHYHESVLVGYRWYETKGIEPLYPFGHGLSYTTFELSKAKAAKTISAEKPLKVTVRLANTGKMAGAEVVQLYVQENNPTVLRPKKELKAFKKVHLEAGDKTTVTFELNHKDLAFWNDKTHAWEVNKGTYTLHIGNSSANISQTLTVEAE
ncbi:MAG: glycoside hydrolase family 3 C-terminal domain-containing protein [Alistipes sp.]|nr:glycoside hydrolase family 3 C-terminal domain-containing protein [Alistipes sp.]